MSDHTISLAFSVLHHYLKLFAEKQEPHLPLPSFPPQFKQVDISPFLSQAEHLVLGKQPELKESNKLFSLFENINQEIEKSQFFYDFKPLSPNSIFPTKDVKGTDFSILWQQFVKAVENDIPISHRNNLSLWLDHFDTAMQCFTCNLPSPYSNEISFYDFTKAVAAFAVALADEKADKENPFLLIQGDFFGIQDFIFSGGSASNKGAAKILRGRSFQVSLFTELAALKILNVCKLPTTSQMMNAAGKFLIVAPNTEEVKNAIKQVQSELNQWFIKETYGLIGLGIAVQSAKCGDFEQNYYETLVKKLFENLEEQKLKRLDLTDTTQSVQEVEYPNGVCEMNSFFPSQKEEDCPTIDGKKVNYSVISEDQINIGKWLSKKDRIIITDNESKIHSDSDTKILKLPIFGFNVIFTEEEEETGKFGLHVDKIHRFWDFSLPNDTNTSIWNGYARRYINAYVPRDVQDQIITFEDIETQDKGQKALMTLKGDVDNLGTIFQKGIQPANIAKMAALSRQMNLFFSLWLPAYCAEQSQSMYTVFAGGDDFFLIGPWYSTQKLAHAMQQAFSRYVAENPEIHFSVGMVMSKSNIPVPRLGDLAEEALEKSKKIDTDKNAITIFNRSVKWKDWQSLCNLEQEIHRLAETYNISTSYLYSLIRLCEQAANTENIESAMWRSRFYYRTARYVTDKLSKETRNKALNEISISLGDKGIGGYKLNFAIPLTNYFYQKR
jgi:CRISPR-associated protein, csm1 family|nr:type III-A CRISPR-associated protein Cas10/Csm1 [uncultured Aggregatibacter sp.]